MCNLSKIDNANIALLHPGARLVVPKSGPALLEASMSALQLLDSTKTLLRDLAAEYKWYEFRQAYLAALQKHSENLTQDLNWLQTYIEDSLSVAKKSATINPNSTGTVVALPVNMCSTEDTSDTRNSLKSTIDKKAAHAVSDPAVVDQFVIHEGQQSENFVSEICWKLIFFPDGRGARVESDDANQDEATIKFRRTMLQEAMKVWESYASIEFREASDIEVPDLLIVFQDSIGGVRIEKTDGTLRSYVQSTTRAPDPANPLDNNKPPFKHRVCFRAISKSEEEAKEATNSAHLEVVSEDGSRKRVTHRDWDRRTLIHEVSGSVS